jgi:hypothetical protein
MTAAETITTTAVCQPQAARRAGLFIVLDGISGSGKSARPACQPPGCPRTGVAHRAGPDQRPAALRQCERPAAAAARVLPVRGPHASDLARDGLQRGHVIADRYLNSVIATTPQSTSCLTTP